MSQMVDLTNCDKEPIHIPGKIQAHGVLLAIEPNQNLITHVSENIETYFPVTGKEILQQSPEQFFAKADFPAQYQRNGMLTEMLEENNGNLVSKVIRTNEGKAFHFVVHNSGASLVMEFEPVLEHNLETAEELMSSMLTAIMNAQSLSHTLNFAAERVKQLIGYDRVMIYKFAEDGHGEVVAEAVSEDRESFFGLHYPASDIPQQARELYKRNLVRIISDVNETDSPVMAVDAGLPPLDLTDSILRAVSPIHIQYLKNMGVSASFSVSLMNEGQLWGLIACHHYDAKLIDYKVRNSCKVIGQLLSTSLLFRQTAEYNELKHEQNEKLTAMVNNARQDWKVPDILINKKLNILDLTQATGAAILFEGNLYATGKTPTSEQITDLAAWLNEEKRHEFYQTTSLSKEYPAGAAFSDVSSGVMSITLSRELGEYIFWFKKELPQVIRWAGNPDKSVEVNPNDTGALGPRRSFDTFIEEVTATSEGWTNLEITLAMKLREELVNIIRDKSNHIRKLNEQLKQAYDELDTFSFTISHDLKTPLASIKNYSEIIMQNEEGDISEYKPMLSKIVKGADKMNLLIKEVLGYTRISRQRIHKEDIDMLELLTEIKSEVQSAYRESDPEIKLGSCPPLYGDSTMVYQVFSNLINNGVKYSSGQQKARVTVEGQVKDGEVIYSVADNGIGIDMKTGDQVFELFKRMSNAQPFEGTGVGLAIVKRIVIKHEAKIWFESEPGNGTIFYISFKTHPNDSN